MFWWILGLLGFGAAIKMSKETKGAPVIINPSDPNVIDAILRTIRIVESRNNYTIHGTSRFSDASGAYQFISTTWGGFKGYKEAWQAPPAVQDAKARINVMAILKAFNNDLRFVPAAWYMGINGAKTVDWNAPPPPGNKSTVNQYVAKWMAVFSRQMMV